ncbi:hypothetical protein LCGC14_0777350 [marine sediment metagenome]|uniref:Uncharacterized protein n=1 Tax=marine sediment metagenome TaxID=412755 RepID=A0A0F9PWN2_9ZZZZ
MRAVEQRGGRDVSEIRATSHGVTRAEARWMIAWSFLLGAAFSALVITGAVVWRWWSAVTWVF